MSPDEPLIRWNWLVSNLDTIWSRLIEHLVLTLIAVGLGFLISVLATLLIRRLSWTFTPITWTAGVAYTIPSLALFALLVPITGLTVLTAEIGLVSYTLLILIRGLVGGLQATPSDVREAAKGMGLTDSQILWKVEAPLSIPVVVAALRVATVTTVGLVTVTALIGQGGLGYFILLGLSQFFTTPLLIGAVLSIALAVGLDLALVGLQHLLTPWRRVR